MKEPNRTRMMELSGVFMLYFFSPKIETPPTMNAIPMVRKKFRCSFGRRNSERIVTQTYVNAIIGYSRDSSRPFKAAAIRNVITPYRQ